MTRPAANQYVERPSDTPAVLLRGQSVASAASPADAADQYVERPSDTPTGLRFAIHDSAVEP